MGEEDYSLRVQIMQAKPILAVVLLQFGYAGLSIIAKYALDAGMNHYTFVVYRHVIAAAVIAPFAIVLERKRWPRMTFSIFTKIMLMGLLEPVIDQNLYYVGMKITTATFATAMTNIIPAFTFLVALVLRLEKVNLRRLHSQAKVVGTLVTVGGAMLMTLVKGPAPDLPWTKGRHYHQSSTNRQQHPIKGALMITAGCVCWACFMNLQAHAVKSYPAQLSLTTLICLMGALEGAIVTLIIEHSNASIWVIPKGPTLCAVLYGGIVCSAIAIYIQGVIMGEKGPVFVSSFNPLSMIIVAILSSFIFAEALYLGRVLGAVVIIIGLYLILWGKSKDQPDGVQLVPIDQQMARMNGNAETLNGDSVTKVIPVEECV
ncbi:hypothetical protein PVL29_016599 [Vitis rotundifolia]|uniref:WAT1-related protein n=2 Tax=Vitis rotundifolia TaxID=103349 RepID=A0AA39DHJ1_VITRO|nr:hypothetical protein PVL29_016599 [Vitis rotundifolia]